MNTFVSTSWWWRNSRFQKSRDAVCGCEQHNILGVCRNLRQAPFLLQRKIKTKNIGDINYGNEGHFEQNVEP